MREITKLLLVLLGLLLAGSAAPQSKIKPWTQWNQRDAEKILNNSAWAQEEILGTGTSTFVVIRVRLLSAKPIRQALMRLMELRPSETTPEQIKLAQQFIEYKYESTIVVAVNYERYKNASSAALRPYFQAFSSAVTSTLKNNTYLEIKGKRLFLQEYQAPTQDGLGAKFIFPRYVEDQLFVSPKDDWVRFYAEWPQQDDIKIDVRFKVVNFLYDGILEY